MNRYSYPNLKIKIHNYGVRRGISMHVRVRWLTAISKLKVKLGRCDHDGTFGPAGGDQGQCVWCHKIVDWDDE